ncbi:MAG: 50S ribosomal protein L11 methyltransferase [Lachnospiraceae bacterium]|nr:50S ribosomal protein L11 methyltransferase [Lachnospiraceae bacterium]
MKWLKIAIKTTTEAEDIIISSLYDIGLEGAEIEDNQPLSPLDKEQMFIDVMPEFSDDDGIATLNFFVPLENDGSVIIFDEPMSPDLLITKITDELNELKEFLDIGEGSILVSETADLDWINNWKQYFHQFTIDDILIVPSWEDVADRDSYQHIFRIDPGLTFGTGMHETTQLCIRQLKKHLKQADFLLDIGCGSGILAILSLMFGAAKAFGTDLDSNVLEAVKENCLNNEISPSRFEVIIGNIINDEEVFEIAKNKGLYDVITANILTEVLVPLIPVASRLLKEGGVLITSGIIGDVTAPPPKALKVIDAMQSAGMEIIDTTYQGEWVNVTGRKV